MADSTVLRPVAILTRPQGRNTDLAARLEAAGWQTCVLPALDIEILDVVGSVLPRPEDFELVVFVSGNAARIYLRQLRGMTGMQTWPAATVAATVGPASAQALYESGFFGENTTVVHPNAEAPRHDSEALLCELRRRGLRPQQVLIVRGTEGRNWLADRLIEAGASVLRHAVYRRRPTRWSEAALQHLHDWSLQGVKPTWLLTSTQGIAAVQDNLRRAGLLDWWLQCPVILTHPVLAAQLSEPVTGAAAAAMVKICLPTDDSIFDAFVAA